MPVESPYQLCLTRSVALYRSTTKPLMEAVQASLSHTKLLVSEEKTYTETPQIQTPFGHNMSGERGYLCKNK